MENYKYTNKLLKALAICNLWVFVPAIWGTSWAFKFALAGVGDDSQLLMSTLFSSVQAYTILIFTTWAFLFRRWYWVVIFYVIYLSYEIPRDIVVLVQYWKDDNTFNFLNSSLYGYTAVFTWLLGIITIIVMLSETPYRELFKRLHSMLRKLRANFIIYFS